MNPITHYDILEVSRDASKEEIRKAYKEGIKITHPDRHGGKGGHLFILIEEAWRVLSDDDLKSKYDASLDSKEDNASFSSEPQEPDWGEESLWDEDLQGENQPYANTREHEQGERSAGAHIPPPIYDVNETPWVDKPQISMPEVFVPKKQSILVIVGLVILTTAAWVGAYLLIGKWALLFIAPSAVLGFYIRQQRLGNWDINLPLFGVVGGVVAGWQTLEVVTRGSSIVEYLQLLFLIVAFLGLPMFTSYKIQRRIKNKVELQETFTNEQAGWKILGKPGNEITDAVDENGRPAPAIGQVAEQMTADVLESLLKIPGVRIIHGLRFPGSANNDVDHAVVYGNKVALIESKLWESGSYGWNNRGEIVRDGQYRDMSATTFFPTAASKYANIFTEAEVGGFLIVHAKDFSDLYLDNSYSQSASGVGLVTPQAAIDAIGDWFLEDNPKENVVDRSLLWKVWQYKLQ